MEIQRYKQDIELGESRFHDHPVGAPEPDPEGDWVRYEDVAKLIEGAEASEIPSMYPHPFTKDTLIGDYKGFRREIWSQAAYDTENGVKGVWLGFALIGPESAITAGIFTDLYLPETVEKWEERGIGEYHPHGEGGIVDFHWGFPIEDIEPRDDCLLIEGQCWSISTFTLGEQICEALCREGFDGVWHDLHEILVDQTEVQRAATENHSNGQDQPTKPQ